MHSSSACLPQPVVGMKLGLSPALGLQLATCDNAMGLENLRQSSIQTSQHIAACWFKSALHLSLTEMPASSALAPELEPMKVDALHSTWAEQRQQPPLSLLWLRAASFHTAWSIFLVC